MRRALKSSLYFLFGLVLIFSIRVLRAEEQLQPISFTVRHDHRFGHCEGSIRLDEGGIVYETRHQGHGRVWSFSDIRDVEILSKTRLVFETYGEPDKFDFRLRERELTAGVYRLLAEHIERGVTSRVLFTATEFLFQLPVKHRHRLGGCAGVLLIGATEIVYKTENAGDGRIWRIRDIRSFGTTGAYDLRLTTEEETFSFDLKEPLSQKLYDHLWQKIYGPQFAPVRGSR